MSQSNEANDYKIIKIQTDVSIPNDNIIKFEENTRVKEQQTKAKNRKGYFIAKRIIDVTAASLMGIVLSPILLAISIAIKLDSKGPILYKQVRTGKGGKNFTMYKFRSMEADNDVYDFTSGDKNTRVGKFIRKTSLDELPQIINIIKGDMSFIGPRPWLPEYMDVMDENQKHRYDVLPGITGLAQAMGRNSITMEDRIRYDLEYVDNCSLKEDVKVVFKTVETVLSKCGINQGKCTVQSDLEELRQIQENKVNL